MVTIHFHEKLGCINNTKQKALLQSVGHHVVAHNLLTESWTQEQLRCFFGNRPVEEWFNKTAPAIKSGQVDPRQLDSDTALALMLQDPLLVCRPLIQVGDRHEVGFDISILEDWIGLRAEDPDQQGNVNLPINQDLQTCPHTLNQLQS